MRSQPGNRSYDDRLRAYYASRGIPSVIAEVTLLKHHREARMIIKGQVVIHRKQLRRAEAYGWRLADDQSQAGGGDLVVVERR